MKRGRDQEGRSVREKALWPETQLDHLKRKEKAYEFGMQGEVTRAEN